MRPTEKRYCLYIGFCLAILPVLLLRDYTPSNELRYLSIADEALRNHHFFIFTHHGVPYADKPPLYLWLVMLLRTLLGSHQMWALSLLSVVPALCSVRIMDRWCREEMGVQHRLMAKMMLLSCGIFAGAALTLRMDLFMCLFILLAMRSSWRIYTQESGWKRARWLMPCYLFLALFTKGPLGILIPLCASIAFLLVQREPKRILSIWGWRTWSVLVVGCAVWWGLVYAEGGGAYLHDLLFHQTIDRAVNAFHHNRPFYFYLVCIWYCLAPWTLHVLPAMALSLRKRVAKSPLHVFFLTSALTTLALLSCLSGKLAVYLVPAIPFMVYATTMYLPRVRSPRWGRFCQEPFDEKVAFAIFAVLFVGGFALPYYNQYIGYGALCKTALARAEATGIRQIAAWQVADASDMDVYLHQQVAVIADENDPKKAIGHPTLLLVPSKRLDAFSGYKAQRIGHYAIVEISRTTHSASKK